MYQPRNNLKLTNLSEYYYYLHFNFSREQLGTAISEREKQSRQLKEEQKSVQEVQVNNQLQKQLWSQLQEWVFYKCSIFVITLGTVYLLISLFRLMEVKLQCYKAAVEKSGTVTIERGSETLVLL